jgi:hypothetical protein
MEVSQKSVSKLSNYKKEKSKQPMSQFPIISSLSTWTADKQHLLGTTL